MGHTVTPSPTPSADGLPDSLPTFVDEVNTMPAEHMTASIHGSWGYGTPPLDDGAFCDQDPLFNSSQDAALVSGQLPFGYQLCAPYLQAPVP